MKRMVILAAALAVSGLLPVALQAEPETPKVAVTTDAAKRQGQGTAASDGQGGRTQEGAGGRRQEVD